MVLLCWSNFNFFSLVVEYFIRGIDEGEVAHIRAQGEKTYGAFFSWRRRLPVVDSTTI
ncbi:WD repeat-containing slp1 [Gossypium arboreum]|uniref:WD repeat-containing slp1 n=1 Tax=Gossypium arboreum TaxID=29729 RepID=A0A0B0N4L0_GOSAR|nr:WD repeat-containing slp1 [Gossypium arboreum]